MSENVPRGLVLTGLSGAGKSIVSRCFEDLGFRCVGNLPLDLIQPLFQHAWRSGEPPMVVVLDVRTPGFAGAFPELIARLRESFAGLRLVFVEASTDAIVRRFSETRRRHPYRRMPVRQPVMSLPPPRGPLRVPSRCSASGSAPGRPRSAPRNA